MFKIHKKYFNLYEETTCSMNSSYKIGLINSKLGRFFAIIFFPEIFNFLFKNLLIVYLTNTVCTKLIC